MTSIEAFSIAASAFSITLAVFAIWLAFQQRKESQDSYEKTRDVLSEIGKVMDKTELLVSENFQNLLRSITEQQNQLVESLAPKPSSEDKMSDLIIRLADEPEKLIKVAEAIGKVSGRGQLAGKGTDLAASLEEIAEASRRPEEAT